MQQGKYVNFNNEYYEITHYKLGINLYHLKFVSCFVLKRPDTDKDEIIYLKGYTDINDYSIRLSDTVLSEEDINATEFMYELDFTTMGSMLPKEVFKENELYKKIVLERTALLQSVKENEDNKRNYKIVISLLIVLFLFYLYFN